MILYTSQNNIREIKKIIIPESKLYLLKENMGNVVTLYHRVGYGKMGIKPDEAIKSVVTNGLMPKDSGDGIGNAVWFSNNENEYGGNGNFVLSLDFDTNMNKNGINNPWDLTYNGTYAMAYKTIPFKDLKVVKIPVMTFGNIVYDNTMFLDTFGGEEEKLRNDVITSLNKNPYQIVIYGNIFNKYVQPYMKTKNILQQLNNPNIIIKNIF